MNIFDFDNTIYDGESSFDFFFFCLRDDKKLALHIPMMLIDLILYKTRLISVNRLYADAEKLCRELQKREAQLEEKLQAFWEISEKKLKPEICALIRAEDVIITASPKFLIDGILDRLGTENLIASQMDVHTGRVEYLCFREEKITQLRRRFGDEVDSIYTDSLNDAPLIDCAKKAYLVRGTDIRRIK